MSTSPVMQRSFGGGELAPALAARADTIKYATGLRKCLNFLVERAGGVSNRAGTRYVATCKTASPTVQLVPYVSELAGESVVIEAGASYLRFYKEGAAVTIAVPPAYGGATQYVIGDIVLQGGVNYWCRKATLGNAPPNVTFWYAMPAGNLLELPSPFPNLFAWSQSGRVLTLTHEDIAPHELTYEALTRWTLKAIATAPVIPAPTGAAVIVGSPGTRRYAYVITAARASDYEESEASGQVIDLTGAEPTPGTPNVVSWDAPVPPDAVAEYYVYADPHGNGIYGYIGTAAPLIIFGTSVQFFDPGYVPDFTKTPPLPTVLFATANNYPAVSASYGQRRFFARTKTLPDVIHASRVGFPNNYGISSPLQDDDALEFRLAGNQHNPVRHLVPLKKLIVLTDAAGWIVAGGQDGVLSPAAINADQYLYAGAASVRPVVVGNSLIYVQARGRILRDVQFEQQVEGLAGRDITIYSSHLFDKNTIRDVDYAQTPHSIIWAIRDDGVLLGCTYIREQEVWGWHRHTTDGFFWSVCVVPESDEDAVYFIVRRTINGATVRYVERMATRVIRVFDEDCFFVDAGLSYSGAPVNNIGGLTHLQGKVVAVVGDGAVIFNGDTSAANANNFRVTAAGTLPVNLPASYSNIHAGLRYVPEIETLDLDAQGSDIRSKKKRVAGLDVLVDASSRSFKAGPDAAHLRTVTVTAFDTPGVDEFSGLVELAITSEFNKAGRVLIQQPDPLPLTILAVIPQAEVGG